MNKYVRKLFGVMFQGQQTQLISPVLLQHSPTSPEEWRAYWQAKGFPWRAEPEIDEKRQRELSQRRAIVPDIKQGSYPFKGMKLSRADVEWLLATHENGRGLVDWNDKSQRQRKGLDLRGADLRNLDLYKLPLARVIGGLNDNERTRLAHASRTDAATRIRVHPAWHLILVYQFRCGERTRHRAVLGADAHRGGCPGTPPAAACQRFQGEEVAHCPG